jgi:DNA-binding transcriptional MocR family regulator
MWRYQEVVRLIQGWIDSGILKPGDRLRSVREMSVQTGFSIVTIHHAYSLLESEGVLEARPRSGFYVADTSSIMSEFPLAQADFAGNDANEVSVSRQLYKLMAAWRERGIDRFGSLHPSDDLLPRAEISTHMRQAFREQARMPPRLASVSGDPALREIIAKRAALRGALVGSDDVVVATSSQNALELCLDAVTRPGDLVLIESPSYFPLFSALQRRQLKVIEIYSHPKTGIDPDQFDYLLDNGDVRACLLMPTNHYPTGVSYSDEVLSRIVAKASARRVPIIENDTFGELSHSAVHASTFKKFDPNDIVLQVGSFASTLGPQYGLGWVLNHQYRERLLEHQFFNDPVAGDAALQRAVAQYILRRSYDRHLRHMREELEARMRRGLTQIAQRFPAQCAVSRPAGGFMCWVRFPGNFDSLKAANRAMQQGIGILPGPLFSVTSSFRNFIGLNFSFAWNAEREAQFAKLAELLG